MPKKPTLHPHSDQLAFDRLLLLIATFLKYPGIGSPEFAEANSGVDSLLAVQQQLQNVATEFGIKFPEGYPTIPTLRKDIETLRRYGILHRRMYRWGYYLGTGIMDEQQLRVLFQALASQAHCLGDSQAKRVYEILEKRLRGLDLESREEFFYPVRQQLNRPIIRTDPDEMIAQGETENTLFYQLDALEAAMVKGKAIEISRRYDAYGYGRVGMITIWPLQLIFYNMAWYLIYEECGSGLIAIGRVDRFANHCLVVESQSRSLEKQRDRMTQAHKLLKYGWGLNLGNVQQQSQELLGRLPLISVKVRFFPPVTRFILEGPLRHPRQKVCLEKNDLGEVTFVDYQVELPERSLIEFMLWVNGYMDSAMVLSPLDLSREHLAAAQRLVARYSFD